MPEELAPDGTDSVNRDFLDGFWEGVTAAQWAPSGAKRMAYLTGELGEALRRFMKEKSKWGAHQGVVPGSVKGVTK